LRSKLPLLFWLKNEHTAKIPQSAGDFFRHLCRYKLPWFIHPKRIPQCYAREVALVPEKTSFQHLKSRTARLNTVVSLICRPSKGFGGLKNKKTRKNAGLSSEAPPAFQLSNQNIEDLKLIYRLKPYLEERGWKMDE
jgi:hypothetical protein